jgi:hypothetical protein
MQTSGQHLPEEVSDDASPVVARPERRARFVQAIRSVIIEQQGSSGIPRTPPKQLTANFPFGQSSGFLVEKVGSSCGRGRFYIKDRSLLQRLCPLRGRAFISWLVIDDFIPLTSGQVSTPCADRETSSRSLTCFRVCIRIISNA